MISNVCAATAVSFVNAFRITGIAIISSIQAINVAKEPPRILNLLPFNSVPVSGSVILSDKRHNRLSERDNRQIYDEFHTEVDCKRCNRCNAKCINL